MIKCQFEVQGYSNTITVTLQKDQVLKVSPRSLRVEQEKKFEPYLNTIIGALWIKSLFPVPYDNLFNTVSSELNP